MSVESFRRKYIGDRNFYRTLLKVVLPIIIQNLITNFVSMLDNIMVGKTGTDPMTGVSIANQLIFVFNIMIFGAVAGAGIFTAAATATASGLPCASSLSSARRLLPWA